MHGISLVPAFSKDNTVKRDHLWWSHEGHRAIRIGDWKLVADHAQPWELFDLSKDRSETDNLASKYPEKVIEMEQVWTKRAAEFAAFAQQDLPPKPAGKAGPIKPQKPSTE
jgi:arylsulfatase